MRLAVALGYVNVDGMLAGMSSAQLVEWMAYFGEEPFGHVAEDARFATMTAILANANRGKGQAAYKPKDFMLVKQVVSTGAELYGKIRNWALMNKEK